MIRKEIAQSAIDLAEEFDRRGLGIAANPGSEIGRLIGAGTVTFTQPLRLGITPEELNAAYQPTADEIEADSSMGVVDEDGTSYGSQHALILEEEVTRLADDVRSHLAFARGVVTPAVKEYHQRIENRLNALPTAITYNPIILKNGLPEPLYTQIVADALKPYAGVKYQPITLRPQAPALELEQILELLTSGNASLDAETSIWVNKVGSDLVKQVYDVVFSSRNDVDGNYASLVENKVTGTDAALAAFLIGRRVLDNPIEGCAVSLGDWTVAVGEIVDQAGLRLVHAVGVHEQDAKANMLITTYNTERVNVNAVVYENFLSSGGNDAILFGNLLADTPDLYVGPILDKASENLERWERKNRMMTTAAANRRFVDIKSIARAELIALLSSNLALYYPQAGDGGQAVLNLDHPLVVRAIEEVEALIEQFTLEGIQDTWRVATELIAKGVFYYTDAFQILDGINRASAINPDIDAMEASFLSTVEYVADYLFEKLSVVKL